MRRCVISKIKTFAADSFGKLVLDNLSEIENQFNLKQDFILYTGSYFSFNKMLVDAQSIMAENRLFVIQWSNKIYVYYYDKLNHSNCAICLKDAIKRNLSEEGPSYQAMISDETLLSHELVFKPDIMFNALYLAFIQLSRCHEVFLNGQEVLIFSLQDGTVSTENLFIEVDCEFCNSKFQVTPIDIDPKPELSHSPTRHYSINHYADKVNKFCGKSIGLVNDISYDLQLPVASCTAKLILRRDKHELTLGRGLRFSQTRTIAVLEALERLSGIMCSSHIPAIESSYLDLSGTAINPEDFCLHSPDQYQLQGFPFKKFNPEQVMTWVKGVDLNSNKETLVPQSMIFYGAKYSEQGKMLAFESSNGCAIGSSYAEAAVSGILEVVERDAFLYAWYKRKKMNNITQYLLQFEEFNSIYQKSQLYSDIDIQLYESTMEHGIPSVFAIATTTDPNKPNFAAAGGAGVSYQDAAQSALYELSCHYVRLQYLLANRDEKERGKAMLENAFLVKKMEDHGLVNALPESARNYDFLLQNTDSCLPNLAYEINSKNPEETLHYLVKNISNSNMKIILVDQTPVSLRHNKLFCVKVLISSMLPITFGHLYSRINSHRFHTNISQSIDYSKLCPHPFP